MPESPVIQTLKSAFERLNPLISEAEWSYMAAHCHVHSTGPKTNIIEQGNVEKDMYFLANGLVRGFYINDKGEEITIRFVADEGWFTHYTALLTQTPSKYSFQALEMSQYISIPFSIIQEGYRQFKQLEKFGRLVAENILIAQQKRIEGFQFLSAEQRYLAFIAEFPTLFNRISLSHLSTYLGIQRQSLTRIRKKIATQKN